MWYGLARAKLTEEDIPRIRDMLRVGEKQKNIADLFQVHPSTICSIKHGRVWNGR